MKKQSGFTLIELMIVVAIVAILAAVAMPAYKSYTAKAKFTEVTSVASALKTQVQICEMDLGTLTGCTNTAAAEGSGNGWKIDKGTDYATQYLTSIIVTNGTIVANVTANTITNAAFTYTLTPTSANGVITWTAVCSDTDIC